jgi:putative Holliday junction resolvase
MPESIKLKSLLAFDFGLKQIGVAYGQTLTKNANALSILKAQNGKPQWLEIDALITQWKPNLVLVGLPLNMDDTESELSARARKFARRLEGRFNVQVEMVDERLTSQEAKSIIQGNSKRGSSTEDLTKIDHIAAALILQSWLDDSSIGRSI